MMNRRLTYLLLLIAALFIIPAKVRLTLAQGSRGTFTQGTEACSVNPDTKCGHVDCTNITWFSNTVCNPDPDAQTRFLCDSNVKSGCTITETTHCSGDQSQLSFGYACSDGSQGVTTSTTNTCPVSCEDCSGNTVTNSTHTQCVACTSPQVPNQEHNKCVCPSPTPTPPTNCDTYLWLESSCKFVCSSVTSTCANPVDFALYPTTGCPYNMSNNGSGVGVLHLYRHLLS